MMLAETLDDTRAPPLTEADIDRALSTMGCPVDCVPMRDAVRAYVEEDGGRLINSAAALRIGFQASARVYAIEPNAASRLNMMQSNWRLEV